MSAFTIPPCPSCGAPGYCRCPAPVEPASWLDVERERNRVELDAALRPTEGSAT